MQTPDLEHLQLDKLNRLFSEVWEQNPFYTRKWQAAGVTVHRLSSLSQLSAFPVTTRDELVSDQSAAPPLGTNLTYPPGTYKRIHRSSGTTHAPIYWADTTLNWRWVMDCSQRLYLLSGIEPGQRIFFALTPGAASGPSIMFEGACRLGCCCFPGGDASDEEQLQLLRRFDPDVLIGKTETILALAGTARRAGITLKTMSVRKIIAPGQTNSRATALREQSESTWGAQCFDRYGLTEAGSVASECLAHTGAMHLLETEFIAEVIQPDTEQPLKDGEAGELVLTTLGRIGRPIIRYRTGDWVRLVRNHQCPCKRPGALLLGGVRRID
ncbi:MAG: phenylacetate--CoA ligase family protein [Verrucomicrobia bacterium]|nr:phenylacetate--CoA ligase family protein [Verrucomicrobiota bacterium]